MMAQTHRLQVRNRLDALAISLSALCAVHCLLLPLLVALLPALARWLTLPEETHLWAVFVAVPLSGGVLLSAVRSDRKAWPCLLAGLAGLVLLVAGVVAGSALLETVWTVAGAALLAGAHLGNWHRRAMGLHHSRQCVPGSGAATRH